MRVESVSSMRATNSKLQKVPSEGSKLRELWDKLHKYKGRPCDCYPIFEASSYPPSFLSAAIDQLRDFYGCDIIRTNVKVNSNKSSRGRPRHKYALIGEWFGLDYHDYLAERIASYSQRLHLK